MVKEFLQSVFNYDPEEYRRFFDPDSVDHKPEIPYDGRNEYPFIIDICYEYINALEGHREDAVIFKMTSVTDRYLVPVLGDQTLENFNKEVILDIKMRIIERVKYEREREYTLTFFSCVVDYIKHKYRELLFPTKPMTPDMLARMHCEMYKEKSTVVIHHKYIY